MNVKQMKETHIWQTQAFFMETSLYLTGEPSSDGLQHLACDIYLQILNTMPAMARTWWKNQDRKTSAYIDT